MTVLIGSVLAISLLVPTIAADFAVGAAAQVSPPSTPARAPTTQQPADGGWPRAYITASGARLVLYEPQIASWLDQKRMAMYAAVTYRPADQSKGALGTVRIEADTKISVPERLVSFSDFQITSVGAFIAIRAAPGRSTTTAAGTRLIARPPPDQLNRDYGARSEGAQRTRDLGSPSTQAPSTGRPPRTSHPAPSAPTIPASD